MRDSSFYSQLYVAGSTRRTDMWARGRQGNGFDGKPFLQDIWQYDVPKSGNSSFIKIHTTFPYLMTSIARGESILTAFSLVRASTAQRTS